MVKGVYGASMLSDCYCKVGSWKKQSDQWLTSDQRGGRLYAMFESVDYIRMWFVRECRHIRNRDIMADREWSVGDIKIVGVNQKAFEIYGICNIVCQERLQYFFVTCMQILLPEDYSKKTVYPVQLMAIYPQLLFASFQSTPVAKIV